MKTEEECSVCGHLTEGRHLEQDADGKLICIDCSENNPQKKGDTHVIK